MAPKRRGRDLPGQVRGQCLQAQPHLHAQQGARAQDTLADLELTETEARGDSGGAPYGPAQREVEEQRRLALSTNEAGFASAPSCAAPFSSPAPITGPKYFGSDFFYARSEGDPEQEGLGDEACSLPDILYASSDVDPADVVPFKEEAFDLPPLGEMGADHS